MTTIKIELKKDVILPALQAAGLATPRMANLLNAVAFAEHRRNGSRRHGPYGMTEWVHRRVWDHYIAASPDLACRIRGLASQRRFTDNPHLELDLNWGYATALAALNCQFHQTGPLPGPDEVESAVTLWRRAFHRGHRVDAAAFSLAFHSSRSSALGWAA